MPTGACAIHCRYCFRRHFPYHEHTGARANQAAIVEYLHAHPEVDEVIFSGGDPLILDDALLERWLTTLLECTSLKTVRFHTRLLTTLPAG